MVYGLWFMVYWFMVYGLRFMVIIHLHQQGLGYKIIVKQTGATKSTVRDTIKRFQETGEVKNRLRSGRPPCTSPRESRTLVLK